jgi:hypothetical protein
MAKVSRWPLVIFLILVGLLVLLLATAIWASLRPIAQWFYIIALMLAFLALVGQSINGRALGILIDTRYKISLSRLQIALWTVLVLSAYMTMAIPRILGSLDKLEDAARDQCLANFPKAEDGTSLVEQCSASPLNITFPPELILAMGISATSFAGSTLISSSKQSKQVSIEARTSEVDGAKKRLEEADNAFKTANAALAAAVKTVTDLETLLSPANPEPLADDEKLQAQNKLASANKERTQATALFSQREKEKNAAEENLKKVQDTQAQANGLLHKNTDLSQASLADLFRGEEIGNFMLIDMGKVQMFFFTLVVIFTYAVAVAALLQNPSVLHAPLGVSFPPFSSTLNSLLGISHGAYLSVKTVDHTKTTN